MPPEGEEAPKPAEIEVLKAWIAAGAKGPSGAAADPTMLVTPQVKLLAPPKLPINAVALSPDGDVLAIARHGEVELQSLPDRKTLRKLAGIRGSVNGVAFSRDGQFVVAAAGEPGLFGEARLFTVARRLAREGVSRPQRQPVLRRAQPRRHRSLATGGYDSAIKLWNVADGKELRTLDGHNGAVFELAFRPDGKVLASASGDRTVKLWNVATGERLDTLKESQKELYSLAFSPDGTRLAAAGVDNRIRVWRITPDAKEGDQSAARLEVRPRNARPATRLVGRRPDARLQRRRSARQALERRDDDDPADAATSKATGPAAWRSAPTGDTLVVGRVDGSARRLSARRAPARSRAAARAAGRSAARGRLRPAAAAG